jgi:hypothetical protein
MKSTVKFEFYYNPVRKRQTFMLKEVKEVSISFEQSLLCFQAGKGPIPSVHPQIAIGKIKSLEKNCVWLSNN